MVRARLLYIILIAVASLIAAGCSNTKFLTDDQLLYTGSKGVFISDSGKFKNRGVKQTTASVTIFKPNNSLGGKRILLPVGLWVYNYRKPDDSKKSPGWLYKTLAKEPVLISTVNPEVRCRKLESELFGSGYFRAVVWSSIDTGKHDHKKAGITYYIKPGQQFRYSTVFFAPPEDAVDSIIDGYRPALSIKPGDAFDLATVKSETKKISERLQESGYFYFNQAQIKYIADTTRVPYGIDFRIGKNADLPRNAGLKYFIDDITVKITNEADSSAMDTKEDTVYYDGIKVVSKGMRFKPDIFARSIYFRKGENYSTSMHRQTVTHLNSYGIFKFINVRYTPDPDTLVNKLDMLIELTPTKDISLDLEANVVTKSTGFSGPGFAATVAHGNLARGANKLQLKLNGGLEWQWGSNSPSALGTFSYNIGLSSSIIFPKLILPSGFIKPRRFNLPQTSVTLGFEYLNKVQYYRMRSLNLGFGYQWKKPDKITHSFYPVFINSIDLLETTSEFDSIMTENPYIKKSFEEQFIIGMKYDFIYDNSITKGPHGFYFQSGISSSGNLPDLVYRAFPPETERPYTIGKNVYSQFMKISTDFRYYRNIRNQSIVFRFYSGVGFPFSNSLVMPYVEQFYSGGSNSIRAFIARSLGPGGLPLPEGSDIIDQTGDIRLEGNVEYRFRMTKMLHGAFFLDVGNIWLLNPDSTRIDAEFHFNTFADQLAVGTGAGLRFDFNFFILRLDLGFPLRKPYIDTDFESKWISTTNNWWDKLVLNFAIGYPF